MHKFIILLLIAFQVNASEKLPLYNKAMASTTTAKRVISCCNQNFRRFGDAINTRMKQKILEPQDLHMSLARLPVCKKNIHKDNPTIKNDLSIRLEKIRGKKFSITGIKSMGYGNFVAAELEPDSPMSDGFLEEKPHLSIMRHSDPFVREEYMSDIDQDKLKKQKVEFDAVVLDVTHDDNIVKKYKEYDKKGNLVDIEKQVIFSTRVDKESYSK